MNTRWYLAATLLVITSGTPVRAQGSAIPLGDKEPLLRLEAGGPTSFVTALTFSNDGKRLYAGGFDKVVRVWNENANGRFVLDRATYRVPIGPGTNGAINALALAPDESVLAVAGMGIVRGGAGFRLPGLWLPKVGGFTNAMWQDLGVIYLFDTKTKAVTLLRGQRGPILSLAFAPRSGGKLPLLVSVAKEWDNDKNVFVGSVWVWDVTKHEPIAKLTDLSKSDTRPGLAIWHTGKELNEVRIAIAWQDGLLRIWDIDKDEPWTAKDGPLNITATYLADREQIVTTSWADRKVGKMRFWDVAAKQGARATAQEISFPNDGDDFFVPRAFTPFSSRAGGPLDQAAIVQRVLSKVPNEQKYMLSLVDLDPEATKPIQFEAMLWEGGARLPVVAAAPGGRYLAVAGNKDHLIFVYSIADLLKKKNEPQMLRSTGSGANFVSFVTNKNQDAGLLLSKKTPAFAGLREPEKGDLLFDFAKRSLSADPNDIGKWRANGPAATWTAKMTIVQRDKNKQATQWGVVIYQGGEEQQRITLKEHEEITALTLLPPMPPLNVPIVALGFLDENAQPWLTLYHGLTGDRLRQLTGHEDRLRSLAFSKDGRLLVSSSDDQVVCVWTMSKLDKYLGKLGLLHGVVVKNIIVVDQVAKAGAAQGKLKEYDVVDSVEDGSSKHRFLSQRAFYDFVAGMKSGAAVTIHARDADGTPRPPVKLVVGQELTERSRGLLLGLGLTQPAAFASLAHASGMLSPMPGLTLKYASVVASVDAKSPAKGKLDKDDVIEGFVVENKTIPFKTAFDFYVAVALTNPGKNVTLAIRGKGNVVVAVGQGVDERKPLFSLFITRPDANGQRDWVGWSPIGPYESSDPKAERFIGWHFNTGRAEAPATFALADQYRKEYYRDGILRYLVARADLAPALKDWNDEDRRRNLPKPKMTLWIDEVGPDPNKRNGLGQVLARQNPAKLKLAIDDFPIDRVESVEWQVDDGALHKFPDYSGRERTAELNLSRGVHKIRVVMRTYEAQIQEYTREISVRSLPPAPGLKPGVALRQVVGNPAFILKADALQGNSAEDVKVALLHTVKNKKVTDRSWTIDKAKNPNAAAQTLSIDEKLELSPGDNLIELTAVNTKALPDKEGLESQRIAWLVTYLPPEVKVKPPRIDLERVVPLLASSAEGSPLPIETGRPIVVSEPKVRVIGGIVSEGALATAQWQGKERGGKLDDFSAGGKQFSIRQTLALSPGVQVVFFRTKAANSEEAEAAVTIDYQPRLPEFALTSPPQAAIFHGDGKTPPVVQVEGVFTATNDLPFDAEVLLNGQPVGKLAPKGKSWSLPVTLNKPGDNRLQLRLRNAWERAFTSEAINVRYVRPPSSITFVQEPSKPIEAIKTDKPLIDLVARVESPLPLIRETVAAEVNETELGGVEVLPPALKTGQQTWTLRLRNVPLTPNIKNKVRVWISNPESRCLKPGEVTIDYVPAANPPGRAVVELIDPAKDTNVTDADLAVRFRVKSSSPLKSVELVRDGRAPLRESFDVSNLKPNAQGYYEFRKSIELVPRDNSLRVVAINAGGEQHADVVANFLHMPVRLAIDRLEPWGQDGKAILPKVLPDGKLVFSTTAQARLTLQGHITWSKENDEQLKKISMVRIYVNGFQQLPAALKPAEGGSRERTFKADLLLNRAEGNQIELELPDLKQDSSNRREFALACQKPETGQRLHLLVLGIGEKDERKLTDQALLALRASKDQGQLHTPAFASVSTYPLTDFVSPEQVFTQLCLIKKIIDLRATEGSANDVVMIYYQGGESIKSDGNFFETSVSKYDKELRRSGFTFKGLRGFFDETLGAKLLLLDVTRVAEEKQAKSDISRLTDDTYFGVFHNRPAENDIRNPQELLPIWKQVLGRNVGLVGLVGAETARFFKQNTPASKYDWYVRPSLADTAVGPVSSR